MGNMLMNKRIEESILGGDGQDNTQSDYRILPKHMYGVSKSYATSVPAL